MLNRRDRAGRGPYLRFSVTFVAKGDHDVDRMFHGDKVSGTAIALITGDGQLEYEDVTAAVEDVLGGDEGREDEEAAAPEED